MLSRFCPLLFPALVLLLLFGCSGAGDPVSIDPAPGSTRGAPSASSGHVCWGVWDVLCDPVTGSIETIPLRSASFNANVVKFLQPPSSPVHFLTLSVAPGGDIPNGYWVLDITLRHPFFTLPQFRGFDVRGIIMAEGNQTGIHDSGVSYHAPDGTRLLNPDGYTRWWNQQEFTTYGKILGYTEGAKAIHGFTATATVNPYRLFADALDKVAPVYSLDPETRATFGTSPGINTRRYRIQFDLDGGTPPIRFKYAIDASWSLPDPGFAPDYPIEAFDLSANCQEPYLLAVPHFEEVPYYVDETTYGGDAVFFLTVGDWQAETSVGVLDELAHIWVESPTLIDDPVDILPSAEIVGSNHHTQVTLRCRVASCHPASRLGQYFLVTAESANPGTYMPQIEGDPYLFDWPDAALAAYARVDVPISGEPPVEDEYWIVGLPDWCSLTEHCTVGADNLRFVTNLVTWDLEGPYNDEMTVKWWEGHVVPKPPYSTSIIQNHIASLGYVFARTQEPEFSPEGCRVVIIVLVRSSGAGYTLFTQNEVDRMKDYVKQGGILCVLIENPNYFDPVAYDPLMDMLGVPLGYGGFTEPPSDTTTTTDITPHDLTQGVNSWTYWTCGEFILESDQCVSLVRSPTAEHMVVLAPVEVG